MSKTYDYVAKKDGESYTIQLTEPSNSKEFIEFLQENSLALENAFEDAVSNWKYRRAAGCARSGTSSLDWFADINRERVTAGEPTKADQAQAVEVRKSWLDRLANGEEAIVEARCKAMFETAGMPAITFDEFTQASALAPAIRAIRLKVAEVARQAAAAAGAQFQ